MYLRGLTGLFLMAALVAALAGPSAFAGDVILTWDASTGATGYRVYHGTSSGQYGSPPLDVGNVTTTNLDQLSDCTLWYFTTTAYNTAGESGYSAEVSSWPRPRITAASPSVADQGAQIAISFSGSNFQSGASIQFSNPGVTLDSITVDSCTSMTLNVTVGPAATPGPVDVTVTHPDGQVSGVGVGAFSVASTVPPSITSVQASAVTDSTADISWTTDEPADSQVFYRASGQTAYQQTSVDASLVTSHLVALQGLSPDTTYEYHVRSADGDGNASTSSPDQTFTTSDSTAPAISSIQASSITGTSAQISWTTDEPADGQVFYRASGQTSYQQTAVDGALSTSHTMTLQGLSPETSYEYHVRSADSSGNATTSSPDDTFTTTGSPYSYIDFEGEAGVLVSPIRESSGGEAFGSMWIDTPNGTDGTAANPAGTATFGVNVPTSGTWFLWVRVYGLNTQSDSWFESVDGAARQPIAPTQIGVWEWVPGRSYNLSQGLHVVELGGHERRARADRILLTDDPDFVPTVQPGADVTPPQPVGSFAAAPAIESVQLSWDNPLDSDFAMTVVRYRTDGQFPMSPADGFPVTEDADLPGTAGAFTHVGLTAGTTYSYSAFAIDASGNVSTVSQAQAVPDSALQSPDPPLNLIITQGEATPTFLLARHAIEETPWLRRFMESLSESESLHLEGRSREHPA